MIKKDARGQIWRVALPEGERLALILAAITGGALAIPVRDKPGAMRVPLAQHEMRILPAYADCGLMAFIDSDALLHKYGGAAPATLANISKTLLQVLGITDKTEIWGEPRFKRGQVWEFATGNLGLIISSHLFHQNSNGDLLVIGISENAGPTEYTCELDESETGSGRKLMVAANLIVTVPIDLVVSLKDEISESGMNKVDTLLRRTLYL